MGRTSWSKMRTTQDIHVSFTLKENVSIELSGQDAKKLNDTIVGIIENAMEGDYDLNETELYDGGFDDTGDKIEDDTEIEFTIRAHITVSGSYYYDPGVHTYPNGDPGYPPESEWDPQEGWIESLNKALIAKKLMMLDLIGTLIDWSSISIILDDHNNDGELEEVDDYWD